MKLFSQYFHFEGKPLQTFMKDQNLVAEGNETSSSHIGNQAKYYIQVEDVAVSKKLEGPIIAKNRVILDSKIDQKESREKSLQVVGVKEKEQLLKVVLEEEEVYPKIAIEKNEEKNVFTIPGEI